MGRPRKQEGAMTGYVTHSMDRRGWRQGEKRAGRREVGEQGVIRRGSRRREKERVAMYTQLVNVPTIEDQPYLAVQGFMVWKGRFR